MNGDWAIFKDFRKKNEIYDIFFILCTKWRKKTSLYKIALGEVWI